MDDWGIFARLAVSVILSRVALTARPMQGWQSIGLSEPRGGLESWILHVGIILRIQQREPDERGTGDVIEGASPSRAVLLPRHSVRMNIDVPGGKK